jgi:predicted nucleic acid-binding protein
MSMPDAYIAATAKTHRLALVTRNTNDFVDVAGLQLINPWEDCG